MSAEMVHYGSPQMPVLVVAGVEIFQDAQGRYNLNVLHRASEMGEDKAPNQWLRRKSTKALISELESQAVNLQLDVAVGDARPLEIVHGGERSGVYAHELLAVEYAGWISPRFRLMVNQAFIDMRQRPHLPVVKDPKLQMIIEMAIRQDQLEQRQAALEEENRQTKALVVQAYEAAQMQTIAEFVFFNKLQAQVPRSTYGAFGLHVSGYCFEHAIPMRDIPVPGQKWKTEKAYPNTVLHALLWPWLHRRDGQGPITGLQIDEHGIHYREGDL